MIPPMGLTLTQPDGAQPYAMARLLTRILARSRLVKARPLDCYES